MRRFCMLASQSFERHDVNGNPLKGTYLGSDLPMADGFKANAAYFKLGFLDKNAVALGRQFREMLPTLWMKAGAHGPCPTVGEDTPDMLILPENRFAVLVDERQYMTFAGELDQHPEIETVFIVTDSESGYRGSSIHSTEHLPPAILTGSSVLASAEKRVH